MWCHGNKGRGYFKRNNMAIERSDKSNTKEKKKYISIGFVKEVTSGCDESQYHGLMRMEVI